MKASEKLTIAYFNLFTWLGGGEYSVYNLVKHLDRARFHPVMVFNKRGPLVEAAESIGVETAILPYEIVEPRKLLAPRNVWRNWKASFAIGRFLRERKVQVVQCSDVFSLLLLLPSLVRLRIPVVYSVIVFYGRLRCLFFNLYALVFIKKIVTNSEMVKNDLLKKTFGLRRMTSVAYNGVDPAMFYVRSPEEKQSLRRKLGLPPDKKIVGFIGRFEVWKGHLTFLRAAQRLLSARPDTFFLMVGGAITGEVAPAVYRYRDAVLRTLSEMNLNAHTAVWDHRDDIPEIIAALDAVVCSSDYEPFGLVALESVQSGVPVVVSRAAGAVEVLKGVENVYIAEPKNPSSFVECMLNALNANPAVPHPSSTSYGEKSSEQERFSWRAYAGAFERLYSTAA